MEVHLCCSHIESSSFSSSSSSSFSSVQHAGGNCIFISLEALYEWKRRNNSSAYSLGENVLLRDVTSNELIAIATLRSGDAGLQTWGYCADCSRHHHNHHPPPPPPPPSRHQALVRGYCSPALHMTLQTLHGNKRVAIVRMSPVSSNNGLEIVCAPQVHVVAINYCANQEEEEEERDDDDTDDNNLPARGEMNENAETITAGFKIIDVTGSTLSSGPPTLSDIGILPTTSVGYSREGLSVAQAAQAVVSGGVVSSTTTTPTTTTTTTTLYAGEEEEEEKKDIGGSLALLLPSLLHGLIFVSGQVLQLPLFGTISATGHQGLIRIMTQSSGEKKNTLFRVDAKKTHAFCVTTSDSSLQSPLLLPATPKFPFTRPSEWVAAAAQNCPGMEDILQRCVAAMCSDSIASEDSSVSVSSSPSPVSASLFPPPSPPPHLASTGILLLGSPGSGKTSLVLSLAKSAGIPVYRFTSTGLYSGTLGDSEATIHRVCSQITSSSSSSSIVFVEDAEIIFRRHGQTSSELARRCTTALLRAMDDRFMGISPTSSSRRIQTHHHITWIAVASASSASLLDARILGPSRFAHVVQIGIPTPVQREKMMLHITRKLFEYNYYKTKQPGISPAASSSTTTLVESGHLRQVLQQQEHLQLASFIAGKTHGFSPADLSHLATIAVIEHSHYASSSSSSSSHGDDGGINSTTVSEEVGSIIPWLDHFQVALRKTRPSLLTLLSSSSSSSSQSAIGSIPRPIHLRKDILGMKDIVDAAAHAVLSPLLFSHKYSQILQRGGAVAQNLSLGIPSPLTSTALPRGLLLHGASGNGKTILAHGLAHLAKQRGFANALCVQGTDIVSAYVGSSESALASLFARARELSPCILILDQFQLFAPLRVRTDTRGKASTADVSSSSSSSSITMTSSESDGGSLSGAGDRLLSVLLTELDGVYSSSSDTSNKIGYGNLLFSEKTPDHHREKYKATTSHTTTSENIGGTSSTSAPPIVFIIAITENILDLDPAIIRPGRIDTHIEVNLPDEFDRLVLLRGVFARSPVNVGGNDDDGDDDHDDEWKDITEAEDDKPVTDDNKDNIDRVEIGKIASVETLLSYLVKETSGFSRASLVGLWEASAMSALRREMRREINASSSSSRRQVTDSSSSISSCISKRDVLNALKEAQQKQVFM